MKKLILKRAMCACSCGAKATRVHDIISKSGKVVGEVYSCDIHSPSLAEARIEIEYGKAVRNGEAILS